MRLHLLAAATILTGSLFAADPGLVSLAMPDTQFMAGVNVAQVMLSPFGQYLLTQNGPLPEVALQILKDAAGFDPRRDLREILVCSSGLTGSDSGIILARGAFDIPKILEGAQSNGASVETYNGVPIVNEPNGSALGFPNSTLAISGGAAAVRAAIGRMSAQASISSALAAQVNQLSVAEDAWFVSLAPLSQLQPEGPAAMLSKVQQASGGVKFGANAVVTLQAVSATDQDAAALAALLKSLAGTADLFTHDHYVANAALLQSLSATSEGPVTKISLSVPEPQIEEMMHVSRADAPAHTVPPSRASEPTPSSGAVPQRVKIAGDVQKAKLLQHPDPVYPPLAVQARISGVVRLKAIIGKDGTVQNLVLASGHPLLVPSAMEAAKQWVYAPTFLNGQAVEVSTQIEVNFALTQ